MKYYHRNKLRYISFLVVVLVLLRYVVFTSIVRDVATSRGAGKETTCWRPV
jgi:hypothetical protein